MTDSNTKQGSLWPGEGQGGVNFRCFGCLGAAPAAECAGRFRASGSSSQVMLSFHFPRATWCSQCHLGEAWPTAAGAELHSASQPCLHSTALTVCVQADWLYIQANAASNSLEG